MKTINGFMLTAVILFAVVSGTADAGRLVGDYRFIKITDDPCEQAYADIWGKNIVWQQMDETGNIYCRNLDTGIVRKLTGNPGGLTYGNSRPAIYQNLVVFGGTSDDPSPQNVDVWLYDLDTDVTQRISSQHDWQYYARIWDRYIAWQDWRNMPPNPFDPANHDIFAYDLQTKKELPICTNTADELWPDVWEHYVVYQSNRYGKNDIFVYDINAATETRITDGNDYDAWQPRIYNGRVVWCGGPSESQGQVHIKDIFTGQRWETPVLSYAAFDARIAENYVVWRSNKYDNPKMPIYSLIKWNFKDSTDFSDVGWLGYAFSQEGFNVYKDLIVFCQDVTSTGPQIWDVWVACVSSDLNCDGLINFADFAVFAEHWLQ
ncbi:MAG: hypothetical protein NTW55_00775 [Planctomycetota bacterium]|nr:hypothetical protein [Planctomycetota bacterium]